MKLLKLVGEEIVYPVTDVNLRTEFPGTSFPVIINPANLVEFNYFGVTETEPPAYDPITQTLTEQLPILTPTGWQTSYAITQKAPDEVTLAMLEQQDKTLQVYVDALETLFNETAKQKRYDNKVTCAMRAGYAGPFQADGLAFALWMDNCNAYGYQVISDVLSGQRELPTVPAFLAELPVMVWPA